MYETAEESIPMLGLLRLAVQLDVLGAVEPFKDLRGVFCVGIERLSVFAICCLALWTFPPAGPH